MLNSKPLTSLLSVLKVKSERELFQAQMHMEAEKSTAKAEQLRLSASLESEIANKRRLETEVFLSVMLYFLVLDLHIIGYI